MALHLQINLTFTPRAIELRAGLDDSNFQYDNSVPFPGPGDLIAFPEHGGEQMFVVVRRKFTFVPSQVTLEILLDLPEPG